LRRSSTAAEQIGRKAVEMAPAGDTTAMRLYLDRAGRRGGEGSALSEAWRPRLEAKPPAYLGPGEGTSLSREQVMEELAKRGQLWLEWAGLREMDDTERRCVQLP
jgi:hypothetical protein